MDNTQYITDNRQTGKRLRMAERVVARELSLLLAKLGLELGMELEQSVKLTEAALHRAYWGELPDGWRGAIVPVGDGHEIP